ncbi:MAG: hypothetical protein AAF252_14830 [Pseudomonadota bacterium]
MTPDKVPAYFARHGLEENRDYVLYKFRPEKHPHETVPGLELYGEFWQTYFARSNEKSAVRARGSFEQAAEWVIEQAKLVRSQRG